MTASDLREGARAATLCPSMKVEVEKQPDSISTLKIELPPEEVSKEWDIDAGLERLREQSADFLDVTDRDLQMEDFAVVDFEGFIEGKPISEVVPQASKNLHGGKKFWLRLSPDNFLPKFCEQLVGLK